MNCIIVDDDELSRAALRKCVERSDFLNLVAECKDAIEAQKIIRDNQIDLMFLDVEMPEMSGIEFIKNVEVACQVIIVSSKKEYAVDAFEYNVTDYLLKPVQFARYMKAVEKARQIYENVKSEGSNSLLIKQDSKLVKLDLSNIYYIEAFSDYVNIYTKTARYTVLSTMKAIESKLPSADFMRVHRSYIVRLDKISTIEENTIVLNEKLIPVSRSNKDGLVRRLNIL
jgi:DNA-binding LytR/AlgR family response regulator